MSKRRGGAGGGKKNQVLFNKPEEPNFLKRMKAEIGYKEPEEEIDAKVRNLQINIIKIHVIFNIILETTNRQ